MAGRKLGAWRSRHRRLSIICAPPAPGAAGFRGGSGERPFRKVNTSSQAPCLLAAPLAAQLAAESETERTTGGGSAGTDDGSRFDVASSALSCLANSSCHVLERRNGLKDGLEHQAECVASGESAPSFFCGDQL